MRAVDLTRGLWVGSLAALMLLRVPGLLVAQQAPVAERGRFWFNVGAGRAGLDMDCGRCEQLPDSIPYRAGPGVQLRIGMGTSFSSRLRLGAGVAAVFRREGQRDATLLNLATLAQFYPSARGPFFVRGGLGYAASVLAGGGMQAEIDGLALHAELGADLWRLGRWTFAPYAGGMIGRNEEESLPPSETGGLVLDAPRTPRAIYLGIGATWY